MLQSCILFYFPSVSMKRGGKYKLVNIISAFVMCIFITQHQCCVCIIGCVSVCVCAPHSTCENDFNLHKMHQAITHALPHTSPPPPPPTPPPHTHTQHAKIAIMLHKGSNEASVLTRRFVGSGWCARLGWLFKSFKALILDGQLKQTAPTPRRT